VETTVSPSGMWGQKISGHAKERVETIAQAGKNTGA